MKSGPIPTCAGSLSILLLACVVAGAQGDPAELLARARAQVAETIARLPRFMCTQTVVRHQYEPEGTGRPDSCEAVIDHIKRWRPHLALSDRLRLDVSVASGREIYSWVGENRFQNRSLPELVGEGSISNGSFSAFLTAIFRTDRAEFAYVRDVDEDGRQLAEFEFHVAATQSHYTLGSRGREVVTGYEGSAFLDRSTADIVRLDVRALSPDGSGVCEANTTLEYRRARINNADFLLPAETRLHIVSDNGLETENETEYTGCREFLGESRVSFENPAETHGDGSAASPITLPAGAGFSVTLAQDIPVATAAAGDPVRARLATDIRDHSRTLIHKGAPVLARILRARRFYGAIAFFEVALRVESIEVGGTPVAVSAKVDGRSLGLARPTFARRGLQQLDPIVSEAPEGAVVRIPRAPENYVIRSGLETRWIETE